MEFMSTAIDIFAFILLVYMVIAILSYSIMLFTAVRLLLKKRYLDKTALDARYLNTPHLKPVSVIVPVYNEEKGVLVSVQSLLGLKYPEFEVIISNDGSNDDTQKTLIDHYQMTEISLPIRQRIPTKKPIKALYQSNIYPNLLLVDKDNGGKSDALNAGLNVSNYPFFCSVDGDSVLEKTCLLRVMEPLATSDQVIASGGSIRVANNSDIQMGEVLAVNLPQKPFAIMQLIEYVRAFLMGRTALSQYNLNLILSGAFSVFSKEWVMKAGGYRTDIVGEDMELVVNLHRLIKESGEDRRIVFVPDPVCWTEVPETMQGLGRQRRRWHLGLIQSLWKHKKMTFNPKYGLIGTLSFPYFWLIEFLGPMIELGGYIFVVIAFLMGEVYFELAILLSLLFVLYNSIFSMASVLLEAWTLNRYPKRRDLLKITLYSLTETFWFRPINSFWRLQGSIQFLTHTKKWEKADRKGFGTSQSK
ncbi:glycosyltransferase family 2 protein [Lentibacillus saliphilus]|uniref:glycosyltransferase family 2 protein n=1 Tax=Lentibacillus saliphilus TaxID=2737028 RepID=UPI001C30C700|nr:glycosyltransferase [Lentibacillus saliphilus]